MDASFIHQTGEVWCGAVLRDSHGKIVASAWGKCSRCSTVVEAEASACLEGLQSLCTQFSSGLHLENDCRELISGLVHADSRSIGALLEASRD